MSCDASGQALVYLYSRESEAEAVQAKVLTADGSWRPPFSAIHEMSCFSNSSVSARSPAFLAALTVEKNSEDCAIALECPAQ
jgi:hypothetical protein